MSDKNGRVLVISNDNRIPRRLKEAMGPLGLETRTCRPEDAPVETKRAVPLNAAVLALEKWQDLENHCSQQAIEQLRTLSVNTLVLTREIEGSITGRPGCLGDGVFLAHPQESPEMLRGRLVMLMEMGPEFHRLGMQLEQLRNISVPMNHQFLQVDEEMRLASRLQRDFLPRQLPNVAGIRFATIYRPATWVSGDIYDVTRLDEHHIGFYIADAVGHGMPAALLTMFIKRALVTKEITGSSYRLIEPGEALCRLNADMIDQNLSDHQFATCCYTILNTQTLELQVANAGHPPPMLIHKEGREEELDIRGPLLGVFPEAEYETKVFGLTRGDKLLLYSDGVELAFVNEGPDKPLRFRKEFGNLAGYDVETMSAKLVDIINREEGSLHPRDDVTIVGMDLFEPQTPPSKSQTCQTEIGPK